MERLSKTIFRVSFTADENPPEYLHFSVLQKNAANLCFAEKVTALNTATNVTKAVVVLEHMADQVFADHMELMVWSKAAEDEEAISGEKDLAKLLVEEKEEE